MRPDPSSVLAPAQIGVGEIRHARHRPRANAFRYPAYFVRLPMRRLDAALRDQRVMSRNRFNLLSFHDADHGDRRAGTSLVDWISQMLRAQGIADADGEIWLHTFPRVLGYAFKPVSFWFCHRADGDLRAIVCEINNTFGERHCYLLAHGDGRAIRTGEEMTATKIFHVSPFCSTNGRYRFRFVNVRDRAVARIEYDDNDDAGAEPRLLITTSMSGRLAPMDTRSLLSAFIRLPLFTFGVIARIHWQAIRLWSKRTPFFPKPNPPAVEVSR